MRYIELPQPYATALCYGYYEGVHLDEAPENGYETYLVFAKPSVFNQPTPVELLMEIHNEQLFGNLPPTQEMPVNAFIGFITVEAKEPVKTSVWTQSMPKPVYSLRLTSMFDKPFRCDHNREDLDLEKWWPCHSIIGRHKPIDMGFLFLDVNEDAFYVATAGGSILIDLTEKMRNLLLNDPENENDLKKFHGVVLSCGNRQKDFDHATLSETIYELDADGNPVLYPSIEPGKRRMRVSVRVDFKHFEDK